MEHFYIVGTFTKVKDLNSSTTTVHFQLTATDNLTWPSLLSNSLSTFHLAFNAIFQIKCLLVKQYPKPTIWQVHSLHATVQVCEVEKVNVTSLRSHFSFFIQQYFCHFACIHPNPTSWIPSSKDYKNKFAVLSCTILHLSPLCQQSSCRINS